MHRGGNVHFWFLRNALPVWLFGKDRGNIIPQRPLWTLHYWILLCYSSSTDIRETLTAKNTKRVKVLSFPQTGRKVEPINSLNWTFLWAMEKKKKKTVAEISLLSRGRLRKQQWKESKKKKKKRWIFFYVRFECLGGRRLDSERRRQTEIKAAAEKVYCFF